MTLAALRIALYRQACERRGTTAFRRPPQRPWATAELAILADGMAHGKPASAIAAKLEDRSEWAVIARRRKVRGVG